MHGAAICILGSMLTSEQPQHFFDCPTSLRCGTALTSRSSCQTAPQCSFTEPAIRCAREIVAWPEVWTADFQEFCPRDIADAEYTRGCGMVLAVKQHASPERSLKASLRANFELPFREQRSLQPPLPYWLLNTDTQRGLPFSLFSHRGSIRLYSPFSIESALNIHAGIFQCLFNRSFLLSKPRRRDRHGNRVQILAPVTKGKPDR